jgi:hypothetical protein
MFYVGSALRFFTNKGRLTDYFMPGRVKASLEGNSTKVSKDLAFAIFTYGTRLIREKLAENGL